MVLLDISSSHPLESLHTTNMTNGATTNGNGHPEGSKNGSTNFTVKAGLAKMLKGGVIMDVVNAEQVCSPPNFPQPPWLFTDHC